MPSNFQQGGRNGQRDWERNGRDWDRNTRNEQRFQGRADQGYRDLGYRNETRGGGARAGGRSEEHARQRDNEQLRAGYRREEWNRPNVTHNVRSEPHWDPNEWRGDGQHFANHGWDQAGGQSWDEDRYYGSPSYEPQRRSEGQRNFGGYQGGSSEGQRGFGQRERYRNDEGGFGYTGYNQLRGRDLESERNYGERSIFGARASERGSERGSERNESDQYHGQEESFGQRLEDAGRRLVGKVKRMVRNPKNYKRSDERIREDVCDRLALSNEVDPSEIEVTVSAGEVTLTGTVDSRHEKFIAEELSDDVPGVHDVHNQLRIKRAEGQVANTNSTTTTGSAQDVTQRGRSSFGRS